MTKTKIPKLEELIKEWKFDYVNFKIEDRLFPEPKEIKNDYKLFHFNELLSSEDAIQKMKKEGYKPANVYELLLWKDWIEKDWITALGSVGRVDGDRRVPCLDGNDSGRGLSLYWWDGDWAADCRFLGVRNSSLKLKNSEPSPLNLMHLDTSDLKKKLRDFIEALEELNTKI